METEIRSCQNCKNQFTIEPDDFQFYEKIRVPPPTFYPRCRLQRRLTWLKGLRLFRRTCDLCKKDGISAYPQGALYTIYCHKCWWSDAWDPLSYGKDYDFSKPFFKQFNELLHTVPLLGLSVDPAAGELSPYTNHTGHSKHCYLVYYSDGDEDCAYGFYTAHNKNSFDCSIALESERCYDCTNSFKNYQVVGSQGNVTNSLDCFFLRDCDNCQNCFGSANLRNRSYVFFNEQLTKEEYQKRLAAIDLGSHKNYQELKSKSQESWKKFPPRPTYDDFSQNCTGSYVFESKNCQECYDVTGVQDSKYIMFIKRQGVKDCYDYTDWGNNAERLYECVTIGENALNVRFCSELGFGIYDSEYCKLAIGAKQFGCVGVRRQEYCILNRRYAPEEYTSLRAKIIQHMNDVPYTDTQGNIYRYGEFFPLEFSPHAYNDTFATFFFPLTKDQAIAKDLSWQESELKEYETTIDSSKLPDYIRDTPDGVLQEIIRCSTCSRGYRVIPQELAFLKQMNLPLPRRCPFCRIEDKVKLWVRQMTLLDRICSRCNKAFRTHYPIEEAPEILCKQCYVKENF